MKKKILAAAVSAALVGGIGVKTASADAVFAPYFDARAGNETIISLVTKADYDPAEGVVDEVGESITPAPNWIYLYKDPADLTAPCLHADFQGDMTPNDLGSFLIRAQQTIFDDNTSLGGYITPGFAGLLAVSTGGPIDSETGERPLERSEGTLEGEGIVLDGVFAELYTYRMANNPRSVSEDGFDDISFDAEGSIITELYPGDDGVVGQAPVAIWHPAGITTVWQLTTMQVNMFRPQVPNLRLEVAFADASGQENFLYDRDELRVSTSGSVLFDCIGFATLEDFVDPGALGAVENGGWAHIVITDRQTSGDDDDVENKGLLVYKREAIGNDLLLFTSENAIDF